MFLYTSIAITSGLFLLNLFAMPGYKKVETRLIHKNRPNNFNFFWYIFFNHLFDKDIRNLLKLRLFLNLGIADKIITNDRLHIVPLAQKTYGLESNKFHLSDYKYRLQTSKNYMLHFLESQYLLNKKNNIETQNIIKLKKALINLFLCSPAFWQFDSQNKDSYVINIDWDNIKYFAWLNYDCLKIEVKNVNVTKEINYEPENWEIKITTKKNGQTDDNNLYNLHQAISCMAWLIPGGWHSWVHFPFTDFICAWVTNKQDCNEIDSIFYKILWTHSRNSKYNTIAVKSRSHSSNSDFELTSSESSHSSSFPNNMREFLNVISDNVALYQNLGKHPLLSSKLNHPILEFYKKSWDIYQNFVESIWVNIEMDVKDFINFVKIYSNGELNFEENSTAFITRILWATGFCHGMDHNIMALSAVSNDIIQPIYKSNINDNWPDKEWAEKMVEHNIQRYKNFVRVFVDYSPTLDTVNYQNMDYNINQIKKNEIELKKEMIKILEEIQQYFKKYNFNNYYTKKSFNVEQFSISIDH